MTAPAKPKTILILGGTGFLGPQLVEAAKARGHTLTLFNRGKTRPHLFPEIEKLHGDRDGHLEALVGRKWDAVVDTSGFVPRIARMSAELLAPNVGHYLFISTISVYADPLPLGSDEGAPLAKADDPTSEDVKRYYGALKALCEEEVEKAFPGRATKIRPGLIVGPGDPTDRFTYWPARLLRGGEVLAPGDGKDAVQFIDVRDLAEWVIACVDGGTVGTYNAVGPEGELQMSTFLDACKTAAGKEASFTWVDAKWLEAEKVAPWSDMPVWVPSEPDSVGFTHIRADRAKAKGLRFRPLGETCLATVEWWQSLPEERRGEMRAGISAEREAELLAKWKAR